MATAIICIVLVIICVLGVKSYIGKLSKGCCGSGGDVVKRQKPQDEDSSHYTFCYMLEIDGMTCKNCATRIENAFHTSQEGSFLAKVNLNKRTASVYAKEQASEEVLRRIVIKAGYGVISFQAA